ncbi:MAG: hypothetical protein LBG62_02320 [Candidatus Methanoplasma sp.]|jgi:hypothetical protein|nr:hypothetical protein [Candidatus Methanoplasma sp.]
MNASRGGDAAKPCDVAGCDKDSERSISLKQVSKSDLTLKNPDAKNVRLCKAHYREFKKETKSSRDLDRVY